MKSIELVRGVSGSGKTTTIKKLYKEILKNYGAKVNEIYTKGYKSEVEVILQIDCVLIAISSFGDEPKRITRALNTALENKADIAICASKRDGNAYEGVKNFAVKYSIPLNEHAMKKKNTERSNEIIQELLELISEMIENC